MSIVLFGGAILGCVTGVAYFVKAGKSASLGIRLLTSAFGPSLAIIFVVASAFWPERYQFQPSGVVAFYWLQAVPLLLFGFAMFWYPGPRRLHWLLVPVGLIAWCWTFALGWLFIHGK